MIKNLIILLLILLTIVTTAFAEKTGEEKKSKKKKDETKSTLPIIALRPFEMKEQEVSRIIMDGVSSNGYKLDMHQRELNIVFENFSSTFDKENLKQLEALERIEKAKVLHKENKTILQLSYNCDCQADINTWKRQKMIIDIYSNDAVSNPALVKKRKKLQKEQTAKKAKEQAEKLIEEQKKVREVSLEIPKDLKGQQAEDALKDHLRQIFKTGESEGIIEFKKVEDPPKEEVSKSTKDNKKNKTEKKDDLQDSMQQAKNEQAKIESQKEKAKKINDILSNQDGVSTDILNEENVSTLKGSKKCLSDAAFYLPQDETGEDGEFYDKMTQLRSNTLDAFDRDSPEDILKLAQHYLSYGLGDEAIDILKNFTTPEQRSYIAKSQAELFTNQFPSDDSIFANTDNCKGLQKIWSAFWYYKRGNEEKAAYLANFTDAAGLLEFLPKKLKTEIGIALALSLVRNDMYKNATRIIDNVAHSAGQFADDVLLVRGLIDAKSGDPKKAIAKLETIVKNNSHIYHDRAGIALAELKLSQNQPLNDNDIGTLEERAFLSHRDLEGAYATALIAENDARQGKFANAFKRLSESDYSKLGVNPVTAKAKDLFKRIAIAGEGFDNTDNIMAYWDHNYLMPKKSFLLKAFADKLVKNGFDLAALDVINTLLIKDPNFYYNYDVGLLKITALTNLGRYKLALKEFDYLKFTDDNDKINKAKVYEKLGLLQSAIQILDSIDMLEAKKLKARYAMLDEDWSNAADFYEDISKETSKHSDKVRMNANGYKANYVNVAKLSKKSPLENKVFVRYSNDVQQSYTDVIEETENLLKFFKEDYKDGQLDLCDSLGSTGTKEEARYCSE